MDVKHWQIDFHCTDPDEFAWIPVSFGASGAEILDADTVRAFFSGDDASLEEFLVLCAENKFRFLSRSQVIPENWTQRCDELMEAVDIGRLRVVPIASAENLPETRKAGDLFLIPGSGFGTGHHITTEMALSLIQHEAVVVLNPKRVFDLGTGSGVLSIAAMKLYEAAVDAVDIEPDALINARENAALNSASQINFQLGSMEHAQGPYDLVLSNLFAELLCRFSASIAEHSTEGGILILSGILPELWNDVAAAYSDPEWRLLEKREELNWCSAIFQRGLKPKN